MPCGDVAHLFGFALNVLIVTSFILVLLAAIVIRNTTELLFSFLGMASIEFVAVPRKDVDTTQFGSNNAISEYEYSC